MAYSGTRDGHAGAPGQALTGRRRASGGAAPVVVARRARRARSRRARRRRRTGRPISRWPLAAPGTPPSYIRAGRRRHSPREQLWRGRRGHLIPPQRGTFSLFVDIYNNGTYAVTIQSVTVPRPLTPAGSVRYSRPPGGDGAVIPPPTSRVLRDVRLGPGRKSTSASRCAPGRARRYIARPWRCPRSMSPNASPCSPVRWPFRGAREETG